MGNDFYYYKSGIYGDYALCALNINHAMQAVGFGVENGVEYTLIRNSWGTSWGLAGYIKVKLTTSGLGVCNLY